MKPNISIHFKQAILFLGIGLLLGWLFFGGGDSISQAHSHTHHAESTDTWTCPMHPQIREAGEGSCPICGMPLALMESTSDGGQDNPYQLQMTQEAVQLAQLQTIKVGNTSNSSGKEIYLNGTVKIHEGRLYNQVVHAAGRIEKLFVQTTGETVYKGQKLAQLYSPQLISAQRELLEARRLQRRSPQLLEAVRGKLRHWKLTEKQIQQIEETGNIQPTLDIYADASGVVINRKAAVGDHLHEGQPILELANLSKLWVEFEAYEQDLQTIRKGDLITFELAGKSHSAKINYIDPVIDPSNRVGYVRVDISNPQGHIKPEMFTRGKLTTNKKVNQKSSLHVPRSAVLWTGKRSILYIKVPDQSIPTFEAREVVLGEAEANGYLIESGVEVGEEVVTNGTFVVDAAAQLQNKFSMMNRDVSIKGVAAKAVNYSVPETFSKQLSQLQQGYIKLKDALVDSDASKASKQLDDFRSFLSAVDMRLLEGKAHTAWMKSAKGLDVHSSQLKEAKELEDQRNAFIALSDAIIQTSKMFGQPSSPIYVQYCPMANNDQGAYWLSMEEDIRNPYFGDLMMTCGIVTETLTQDTLP